MRYVLFSRIRFAIAEVTTSISYAAVTPPAFLGNSACDSTPMIAVASCTRTCSCWFVGKASMIRFTVPSAPDVCSVPNTRWPVSAAVIAD